MCKECDGKCKTKIKHHSSELAQGGRFKARLEGKECLVVPVVMARADVPMNNALIPESEFHPQSWNGVPVTVGHPEGPEILFGSANSPTALEKWSVGRIFNAEFDGVRLKAQAWVDIAKAEAAHPGLIDALVADEMMDVSTGYFSEDFTQKGSLNGKEYEVIHKSLKPDHLALLPDEVGACSFAEGCGVRANQRSKLMSKIKNALKVLTNALGVKLEDEGKKPKSKRNARGNEDDRRTIIADLLSNDDTPFTPDDEEALRFMSDDTFADIKTRYLGSKNEEGSEDESETEANEEDEDQTESNEEDDEKPKDDESEEDEKPMDNKSAKGNKQPKKKEASMRKNCAGKDHVLSNEDKNALAYARKHYDAHRNELIEEIVANTDLSKKEAESMETGTLEILARNSRPKEVNYGGRATPVVVNAEKLSTEAKAMLAPSLSDIIKANRKKKEAA